LIEKEERKFLFFIDISKGLKISHAKGVWGKIFPTLSG